MPQPNPLSSREESAQSAVLQRRGPWKTSAGATESVCKSPANCILVARSSASFKKDLYTDRKPVKRASQVFNDTNAQTSSTIFADCASFIARALFSLTLCARVSGTRSHPLTHCSHQHVRERRCPCEGQHPRSPGEYLCEIYQTRCRLCKRHNALEAYCQWASVSTALFSCMY